MKVQPIITLEDITVRLRDRWYLQGTSWQINRDEQWAIVGPNGSGKSTLVKAIMGLVPVVMGRITYSGNGSSVPYTAEKIQYVSSEQHREIIARENLKDMSRDFSGSFESTAAHELLTGSTSGAHARLRSMRSRSVSTFFSELGIGHLLERPVRALATGELRKILIARSLLTGPELLILDEPFEGLDAASRTSLAKMINKLVSQGVQIILITHRFEEIGDFITHVLCMRDGNVSMGGPKEEVLGRIDLMHSMSQVSSTAQDATFSRLETTKAVCGGLSGPPRESSEPLSSALIHMKEVTLRYGEVVALERFNWTVRGGENWALLGPNGAGKTTVLNLITGDNLQSYANDIFLFGKRKGSGESIWEIKRHIGFISADSNATYQKGIGAFDVICSGFFDSVGLYRQCGDQQTRTAKQWSEELGIMDLAQKPFDQLSYGQRQLVLVARALVKSPRLLILDEPCSGLDPANRERLLGILDYVGSETPTNLIYVTHHAREILPCITHVIRLERGHVVDLNPLKVLK
ncbi:MAG: ATP-binding cassette domain-containing protein [Pseudomonadota bacterium]